MFTCEKQLSMRAKHEVRLAIEDESITCSIRLTWCSKVGEKFYFGATFEHMNHKAQDLWLQFIESLQHPSANQIDRRVANRTTTNYSPKLTSSRIQEIVKNTGHLQNERQELLSRFSLSEAKQLLFNRVVITGIGVISPLGNNKNDFLGSLRNSSSGIKPIEGDWTSAFECNLGGVISDFSIGSYVSHKRGQRMDRATQFSVAASIQAFIDAGLTPDSINRRRLGVAVGTTFGGLGWAFRQHEIFHKFGYLKMHPYTIAAASPNSCSGEIAAELRANGPCCTFSQGCTSAANAISYGYDQVRLGNADVMLVGGSEAPFIPSIYGAFSQAGLLASDNHGTNVPQPFSNDSTGIILAEGAGMLVIENLTHALGRGAAIYAEILGAANTCDGYDMMQPLSSGLEQTRAILQALEVAGKQDTDIDIIFTHGSGAKLGDETELRAMRSALGKQLKRIFISNLKSQMGYAQGATAGFETIAACLALSEQFVPPLLNTKAKENTLNFSHLSRDAALSTALINCFGFGGKNTSLVLSKLEH